MFLSQFILFMNGRKYGLWYFDIYISNSIQNQLHFGSTISWILWYLQIAKIKIIFRMIFILKKLNNCYYFCNINNLHPVKESDHNLTSLFLNLMQLRIKKSIILKKKLNVLKHIIIVMIMYWARLRGHEFRAAVAYHEL